MASDLRQKTEDELQEVLRGVGSETRPLEFKEAFDWKSSKNEGAIRLRASVIRTALAMHNLPGGGRILIGIHDGKPGFTIAPLTGESLLSYRSKDPLLRLLQSYSSEPLVVEASEYVLASGSVVELLVSEFEDFPTVCAKTPADPSMKQYLQEGAVYVRARTGEICTRMISSHEMSELVRAAALKQVGFARQVAKREATSERGYQKQRTDWSSL